MTDHKVIVTTDHIEEISTVRGFEQGLLRDFTHQRADLALQQGAGCDSWPGGWKDTY